MASASLPRNILRSARQERNERLAWQSAAFFFAGLCFFMLIFGIWFLTQLAKVQDGGMAL